MTAPRIAAASGVVLVAMQAVLITACRDRHGLAIGSAVAALAAAAALAASCLRVARRPS